MSATTAAGPLTLDEFVRRHAGDRVEVIDGRVEAIPMPGGPHGEISWNVAHYLGGHVKISRLGRCVINDTFILIRRDPLRVRGADFAFWAAGRLPAGPLPQVVDTSPDLVVEVRSPSDRWATVVEKLSEYLGIGVRVVVIVDPASGAVAVHRQDEFQQVFHNGDEFTLPDVLPGFAVPVRRFFEVGV
jgi:Uma2 family endonuclease